MYSQEFNPDPQIPTAAHQLRRGNPLANILLSQRIPHTDPILWTNRTELVRPGSLPLKTIVDRLFANGIERKKRRVGPVSGDAWYKPLEG